MSDEAGGTERNRNIWAPWRMEYIDALAGPAGECFLCRYRDDPANDEKNLVLWRGPRTFAVLNRYPYTGGHAMVAPYEHVGDLAEADGETLREMMEFVRDLQQVLARAVRAEGFNVGMNVGRCAGAGLPGHLHIHVVPRWRGDTNFMPVFGGVRVIPQALEEIRALICRAAGDLGLPKRTP